MDENLEGKSEVIPVEQKKSGGLSERGSHVASTEDFILMEEFARQKVAQTGKEIYEGRISVNPYVYKNESSCSFCPYSSVCGIGSRLPGYGTRILDTKETKEEVLDKMRTQLALKQAGKEETSHELDQRTEEGH